MACSIGADEEKSCDDCSLAINPQFLWGETVCRNKTNNILTTHFKPNAKKRKLDESNQSMAEVIDVDNIDDLVSNVWPMICAN